jgi:hypothetical protein
MSNGWASRYKLSSQSNETPLLQPRDGIRQQLPPFSSTVFLDYLVRYIVADDQVHLVFFFFFTLTSCQSIRVVECPEFRQLCMVLRETLIDDDIPRRFKMREAIMKRGQKSFEALKYDLSVSFSTFFFSRTLQIDIDQPSIAISRANQFYSRCLGKLQDDLLLGCDCSLDCPRCHKWAP